MLSYEMYFYYHKTPSGKIEVQNSVCGMLGQKHTHTEKGFANWVKRNEINPKFVIDLDSKYRMNLP